MHIGILGSLTLTQNGTSIVPSAGKPRQVLALLALRNGHTVSVPTLMEEIWGDAIPRSATTTLQTYILQIRRQLSRALPAGQSAKEVLSTSFGGYRLEGSPRSFDLREFERLAEVGDAALEAGDAAAGAESLGRALSLWRGRALQDVPVGRVLATELLGLQEARMRVVEQQIVAELRLGRHATLIPWLRKLAAKNPLQENLHAQLMLALYRSGHAWRALETFQQLRRTLVAELGVEPSRRIQGLHRAILANDPALDLESV
ncbi:AfsR/SARP family transcriptional regulator [Micromonospora sp. NPDC002296]|uniref:AfsR/SARP family transcriptional regulator n=1 Tax=Micromonospora sp. NPDC002296 TaxID=3154271 RepID=UPI00332834F1